MCRIFGFRSVIRSQVHRSLASADNALGPLSQAHPDGWGVAYYVDGSPHVTRAPSTALSDQIFHRLSGIVSSETVLAHIRKATQGNKTVLNCHPFQYGRWTFAHNGDIPNFAEKKEELMREVAPHLRRFILGDTDSEVVFFVLLTHLSAFGPLSKRHGLEPLSTALRRGVARIREVCDEGEHKALLTFIITDGQTLAATQGGKELFWSSHKTHCADREDCPHLAPECEQPSQTGFINHLLFSSEKIAGENVWQPMGPGEILGVDWRMKLGRGHIERTPLPLADPAPISTPENG
jgi:predicted glutamine amidotransferase